MKDLMKAGDAINAKETITSIELVQQINVFRAEEGNRAVLQHSDLLKVIRDEFEEEIGIGKISDTPYKHPQNGQVYPMFELTLSQAKQVLVRESKFVRKAIIAYIDKLENALKETMKLPKTFAEALRLAAEQQEELEKQQKVIEEQKPKVEFYDTVTGSPDTIDMRQVATTLNIGIGRNKIFEILRNEGILDRRNVPYQQYVERGYFRTVESTYMKKDMVCINIKTVVYQKGLDFIKKVVLKKIEEEEQK